MMPLGSLLLLFFLAELTEKLWEEKVLSSHTKEKGHKSRETLNISKVEPQQRDHPVEGELPQKPYLHFLRLCFPHFKTGCLLSSPGTTGLLHR